MAVMNQLQTEFGDRLSSDVIFEVLHSVEMNEERGREMLREIAGG
jgi:hypothetical protein